MVFAYNAWVVRFPELAARGTHAEILALADEAPLYFDLARVADAAEQAVLYNLVVSHLVELYLPGGSSPAAQGLVGRVTSASEGSVSLSLDAGNTTTLTQAWWLQSRYGASFWTLTGKYRRFRYVPGFARMYPRFNPYP